ncbi:ninjurin-2 [Lingula anatina]|uniref:Ninjurin-2 n=1 Tax=Lingula anatina TaxID=7574 RepID=A0A1S3HTF5_LINAN|nr:ninjurin-2 [Lingula anatina]|eukprot:XP_013388831.1 ninjurin-2 [Lingula anatina]
MANPQPQPPAVNGDGNIVYDQKKHFAKGFIDASLVVANAGRLDTLLQTTTRDVKFYVVLVLLIMCVVLQLILAWMLWFNSMYGKIEPGPVPTLEDCLNDAELFEQAQERREKRINNRDIAKKLDDGADLALLFILILNIFITAFGAKGS